MTKIRRGGYVFLTWVGDHEPKHVHAWREGRFIGKFPVELSAHPQSQVPHVVAQLIQEMRKEGRL